MTTITDTALAFMKRIRLDEILAPCVVTATLMEMIVDLAEFLHDAGGHVRHDLPREERVEFAECIVGSYLVGMSVKGVAGELLALRVDEAAFTLPATCDASDRVWTVRDRLTVVLGDVYRELLVNLVDVDMAGEHPPILIPVTEETNV
jgi:hypothetical protein